MRHASLRWLRKVGIIASLLFLTMLEPATRVHGQGMPKQKLVAVLELTGESKRIDYKEMQYLSDAVRNAAVGALDPKEYMIMTRENMDIIISPQERRCLDNACYADVARRLTAHYLIGGNVKDFAGKLALTLEAYEGHGVLLGSEQGEADDLQGLLKLVRELAPKLFARITGSKVPSGGGGPTPPVTSPVGRGRVEEGVKIDRGENIVNAVTDQTGFLVIKTDPPGATVFVNGKEVGIASPQLQLELMVGRYVIVAEMGKLYHPAREEIELTTSGKRVTLTLPPAFGTLEVDSEPRGADVFLDGENVGKTPWRAERKPSGTYSLRVVHPYYLTYEQAVTVQDAKTTKVMAKLEQNFGALTVESEPPGAMITLNDQPTGAVTPHKFEKVQPGVAVIKLSLDGYGEAVERATIKNRETTRVSVKLTPKLGLLVVTSAYEDGTPCDGEVFVDGRSVGQTPWKGEVLATRHEVKVKCEKGEAITQVTVQHNQRAEAAPRISSRFVDNGDGTVTDRRTWLVWSKKNFGGMRWQEAVNYCRENRAGLPGSDWRLPTISELRTLIMGCAATERGGSCSTSAGDSYAEWWRANCASCGYRKGLGRDGCYMDGAFDDPCDWYWSSTGCSSEFDRALSPRSAFYVSFGRGSVDRRDTDETLGVRCVRAGQNRERGSSQGPTKTPKRKPKPTSP